jgi:hypothetical protein
MASFSAITSNNTNTTTLIDCVDNLMTKILNYIQNEPVDNKLNIIKTLFNEYSIQFKTDFFDKFDYMQYHIPHCVSISYDHAKLKKADDIIDIMLSYDITPGPGIFSWGYQTTHLKSLELAFKHNVLPFRTYTHCYLNNAIIHIIKSKRPAWQIIKAIDMFIDNGLDFNKCDINFIVSWNPSVVKYIMSIITKPVDYMSKLIVCLRNISQTHSCDDIKNIIDHIVVSCDTLNQHDNLGHTYSHYICSDYTLLCAVYIYRLPYYEYLIERMLINGADINNFLSLTQKPSFSPIVGAKEQGSNMHSKLEAFVKDISVNRNDAMTFVDELSCFLIPDIAGVVCLHRYILC